MRRPQALGLPARASAIVVVLAVAGALLFWPSALAAKRQPYSALGAGPPIGGPVPLAVAGGDSICAGNIALDKTSEVARFTVMAGKRPSPPLEVSAYTDDGGYRSPPVRVRGGYRDTTALGIRIEPPRRAVMGRFCIRNAGREPIAFMGTQDRTTTRQDTYTAAGPIVPDLTLEFVQEEPVSIGRELPLVFAHMASFKGTFVAPWLLWALALAALVGVPAGIAFAVRAALRQDS